jgi:uncharacterized protein
LDPLFLSPSWLVSSEIDAKLASNGCVVLLGSRQTGKTTLAKSIADTRESEYVDLAQPSGRQQLDLPEEFFSKNIGRLLVFDECQDMPTIFEHIKKQIDISRSGNSMNGSQFLVLGSASRKIAELASKHLAGRHIRIELPPLQACEILSHIILQHTTIGSEPVFVNRVLKTNRVEPKSKFQSLESILDRLWLTGGYPQSYCSDDMDASKIWRNAYLQTYYSYDFSKSGINLPTSTIQKFFNELCLNNGHLKNEKLGRRLMLGRGGAENLLGAFEDTTFIRLLPAYGSNRLKALEAAPKLFIRDSGLLHSVLGIGSRENLLTHENCGLSWEGFVIESLITLDSRQIVPFHYRFNEKDEIDLVLKFRFDDTALWGIEIKSGFKPRVPAGFIRATEKISCTRRFMVTRGQQETRSNGIECVTLSKMMELLGQYLQYSTNVV